MAQSGAPQHGLSGAPPDEVAWDEVAWDAIRDQLAGLSSRPRGTRTPGVEHAAQGLNLDTRRMGAALKVVSEYRNER